MSGMESKPELPRVLVIVEVDRTRVFTDGAVKLRIEEAGPGIQEKWWNKWLPWRWWQVKRYGQEVVGYVDRRGLNERLDEALGWACAEAARVVVDIVNEEVGDE